MKIHLKIDTEKPFKILYLREITEYESELDFNTSDIETPSKASQPFYTRSTLKRYTGSIKSLKFYGYNRLLVEVNLTKYLLLIQFI